MPYPVKPRILTSFAAAEQAVGDGSFPGQELDDQLFELKRAIDELNDALRALTRSDGQVRNGAVASEQLSDALKTTLGI